MKKLNRYIFFLATILLPASGLILVPGCKKYLNVNTDPNHPLTVAENVIIPPVEVHLFTNVVGGFPGTTVSYWVQFLSLNQSLPDVENYFIQPKDVNNTWSFDIYPAIEENLKLMIGQSEIAGHNQYVAIGYGLMAYTLAITTDLWGDIPWSQSFQLPKIITPVYDPQQAIYGDIQNMLDSALYYAAQPASKIAPGSDDYIYKGNMAAWTKWLHVMKARYYLRLSNAPGRTAATQADSALAQAALGFQSNADNALMPYPTSDGSPWYVNTDPAAGGVVLAKYFIDLLQGNHDPRLGILTTPAPQGPDSGLYVGRPEGLGAPAASYLDFSQVNTFYAGLNSPLYLATYSEQLFIEAEATLIKSGATAAKPYYLAAIGADLAMLRVKAADSAAYVGGLPALDVAANPLQSIITEKYIAGFLGLEPYNDFRRTGYPVIPLAQNALLTAIPKRWPYPTQELLANPQPQDSASLVSPVWWGQ